jgi:hypothetical protein
MTQYLFSVHSTDASEAAAAAMTDEDVAALYAQVDAFNQELKASGAWVFAGGLHPADTATVVSSVAGEVTTTDGPFIESKEHLGGFWVIEAADLDVALALAARASAACMGPVEVRPFQDVPQEA